MRGPVHWLSGVLIACCIASQSGFAQSYVDDVVVRLDPALDEIIDPNAKLEILKEDYFGATEGPVWVEDDAAGYLLFSDQAANRIYKRTPDGTFSVFLEPSGFT